MSEWQIPEPYCKVLKESFVDDVNIDAAEDLARKMRTHILSADQLGLVELMLTGALSPVDNFHIAKERECIEKDWKLINGTPWPVPLSLVIEGEEPQLAEKIALRDSHGILVATLMVEDVDEVEGGWELGGSLKAVARPVRHDYRRARMTPQQMRDHFRHRSWNRVMAAMTRSPVLARDLKTIVEAARRAEANWMVSLLTTGSDVGDFQHFAAVASTQAMLSSVDTESDRFSILPLPAVDDPARDLALRAVVARNCGCSVILTDELLDEKPLRNFLEHLGIEVAITRPGFGTGIDILGELLRDNEPVPLNVAPEHVVAPWRSVFQPAWREGVTILLTGLPGAGKSMLANALAVRLQQQGGRPVSVFDGSRAREQLSDELGFSPEDRHKHLQRVAYVASEITKNGGVALCAAVAPFSDARQAMRDTVSRVGHFVEVHVSTPMEVCEKRDNRGLYARARKGIIEHFTGITDNYESPAEPEIVIDMAEHDPDAALEMVILRLRALGHIA